MMKMNKGILGLTLFLAVGFAACGPKAPKNAGIEVREKDGVVTTIDNTAPSVIEDRNLIGMRMDFDGGGYAWPAQLSVLVAPYTENEFPDVVTEPGEHHSLKDLYLLRKKQFSVSEMIAENNILADVKKGDLVFVRRSRVPTFSSGTQIMAEAVTIEAKDMRGFSDAIRDGRLAASNGIHTRKKDLNTVGESLFTIGATYQSDESLYIDCACNGAAYAEDFMPLLMRHMFNILHEGGHDYGDLLCIVPDAESMASGIKEYHHGRNTADNKPACRLDLRRDGDEYIFSADYTIWPDGEGSGEPKHYEDSNVRIDAADGDAFFRLLASNAFSRQRMWEKWPEEDGNDMYMTLDTGEYISVLFDGNYTVDPRETALAKLCEKYITP
ncbi:MAG: hypothetical protein Q4P30_00575 [Eubacteriales bacterium]|nr:hypothetical protein [Eubacteriales bacterium]